MKLLLRLFIPILFICCIAACRGKQKSYGDSEMTKVEEPKKEMEDGIRESQEMEFEMTRDPRLGYIPASRLVTAYDDIARARKAGRYPSRTSALNWVERGPNNNVVGPSNGNIRGPFNNAVVSGRMRAVHVDLNDATNRTVWVGSVSGGLWKTNNITASPATWTLVNDFLGNLAIASICQSPVSKNILYFATGERNNNVDAVRGGGVWKSTDNGATWNLLANTTGFWNVSKIVCDAAGNVYVGTNGNGQGLQRSTDGGASWTNITPANTGNSTRITDIKVSSTGRLHVTMSGTSAAGSYYTDNAAFVTSATWSEPSTPIPGLSLNCEIAVAGNVLYALPEGANARTPQIYKSIDGGDTWAATTTSPPSASTEPTINAGQAWFDLAIGVDPADPNVVVAGGLNFYRSVNGGLSWSQITRWVGNTTNYVHADHHGVFWNGSQVLLSTDGGIFYSNDNGFSYTDRNIGIRTLQFYSCAIHPTSTNYLLGGTQDNGSHSTSSPGLGGSTEVHGGDGGFVHIDEDEPQFQFSATTNSLYRRSVNNGITWGAVNFSSSIGQFINPTEYDDVNNRMYCSGNSGTYVRWDNPQTGSTFSIVPIPTAVSTNSVRSFKVSPYTSNRVFMGTAGGAVLRVDNAHTSSPIFTNITDVTMPLANGNIVSCVNTGSSDNNLIATYSNYGLQHVWYSTNGGSSWVNINGNLPDIPVRWAMFHPDDNDKAIIATEMGVFETDDLNGASTVWIQNASFPNVKTNMLQYRVSDRTIVAATHGRGFWTTTIPATNPNIRFASSYTYTSPAESTISTDGCRGYRDMTVNMMIDAAPTGAANVTLTIGAGTAVEGVDYDITTNGNFAAPSKSIAFANGSTAQQPITIRIYDDGAVESTESFVINYSVNGATNAVAAVNSQSYTVQITDNDINPTPLVYNNIFDISTGNTTLTNTSPFRSNKQMFRVQHLYRANELIAAGITSAGFIRSLDFNVLTKNSTKPFNGFTISMGNTTATNLGTGFVSGLLTQVYSGNYTSQAGSNVFNFTTPFFWDGVSNLVINFCFDNGSASADFLADEVEGSSLPLGTGIRASTFSDDNFGGGCNLGAAFVSDTRLKVRLGAISGNPVQTILNSNKTINIPASGTYNFFNDFDIISSVSAATGNLGCVTFNIQEAGTIWQNYFNGQRSQKVFDVSLTGNPSATYTIGFYVTAAELGGKTPASVNIGRTTASTMAGANSSNTTVFGSTVANFGTGHFYTATVSGGGRFFLTDGVVTSVIDVTRSADAFVKLIQNPIRNSVYISIKNESRQNITANLFTNNGQLLRTWNLGKTAGAVELPLNGTTLPAGNYVLRVFADNKAQSLKLIKN
jgi:trimeric autotransporter adhesin